ncbi:MAG: hypothetical protein ABT940_11265 [Alphaproteobacteria bacterium]
MSNPKELKATEEQIVYAKLLDLGMKTGLAALVVTFTIYVLGILPPYLPLDKVSEYWGLSSHAYLEKAHVEPGWAWVRMVGYGDFLNFIGVAFLAGITILCYLPIIPILLRKKDMVYVGIAVLEVAVLTLAASGVLHVGGH